MNEEKRLARNTAIIAIGKICTQFVSFLLLPLYTAMLSTEEYGVVDLITTYVSLLAPIVTLQMENAIFRYMIEKRGNKKEQSKIITVSLISISVVVLIFVVIMTGISSFSDNPYLSYLMWNVCICAYSNTFLQIARGFDDQMGYAVGSFISAAGTVVLNVLFIVVFHMGGKGMICAILLGNALCAVFLFFRNRIYQYIHISLYSREILRELLQYSIPLIPNSLSWWIMSASDRSIILAVLGTAWNGIYSAANKFSSIVMVVYNIFNLSWTESVVLNIDKKESDEFFKHSLKIVFRFFSCACLGLIAIMPFVFPIMINSNYDKAYNQIPILVLAVLCNVVVGLYSAIYVAKKLTKEIAKTSIISAIVNLVVNISLIYFIGIYAASISTLVTSAVMMVWRYIDTKKYLNIHIPFWDIVMTLAWCIVILVTYYIRNQLTCALVLCLFLVYCVFLNFEILKTFYDIAINKIKNKVRG